MLQRSNGTTLPNSSSVLSSVNGVTSSDSSTNKGVGDQLRLAWNHIRFGWSVNIPPTFTPGVPIHFLGRRYVELRHGELKQIHSGCLDGDIQAFMEDFRSRFWFTYRDNFPPISCASPALLHQARSNQPSSVTSDPPSEKLDEPLRSTAAFRRRFSSTDSAGRINLFNFPTSTLTRNIFPAASKIPLSIRTSDCGWGCMLRSGQMLVAQALVTHFLGRDWIYPREKGIPRRDALARMHRQIIRWLADTPESPLSIHGLVQASGEPPGTWFGPVSICRAFVIAMAIAGQSDDLLSEMEIYLARDRVICREEVLDLFSYGSHTSSVSNEEYKFSDHTGNYKPVNKVKWPSIYSGASSSHCRLSPVADCVEEYKFVSRVNSSNSLVLVGDEAELIRESHQQPTVPTFPSLDPLSIDVEHNNIRESINGNDRRGLLLLIPMRLGAGSIIDARYIPTVLHLIRDPSCVGLIGGKPRHSVYAAGSQTDRLIFYDPHFVQEYVNTNHKCFNLNSWHCSAPRMMRAKHLDPSLAFGFYCGSRMELDQLLKRLPRLAEVNFPRRGNSPLIEVVSASEASQIFSSPDLIP